MVRKRHKKIVSKLPKNENIYNFGFLKEKITFLKYTHMYFSFGDARLDAYISLKIKRGFLFNYINAIIIYRITDYYTFAGYNNYGNKNSYQPTAIANRLERAGYLRPVSVIAQ